MNKLNVCFDARILFNEFIQNSGRSDIFFVAKNIVHFLKKRNINLFLYFDSSVNDVLRIVKSFSLDIGKENILYRNSDFSHIDAFLSPVFKIPEEISKFPNVAQYTILYDVIPLLLPEYFSDSVDGWFYELFESLDYDKYYFAISEYTKQDFLKYIPKICGDKVKVIPLSTNFEYKLNKDNQLLKAVKTKYNIPQEKNIYFHYVLWNRERIL